MTRGSITGQVKALAMIVAMQNSSPTVAPFPRKRNQPLRPATPHKSMKPPGLRKQQATTHVTMNDPQPSPAPAQEEDSPARPGVTEPDLAPGSVGDPPPAPGPSQSTFAKPL